MSYKGEVLYMDGTDFDCELGSTATKLFSSIKELKEAHKKCIHECGIVAVTVNFVEYIDKGIPYSARGTISAKKLLKKEKKKSKKKSKA